jgi:2-oxoglutarate ferredoxin oxidoreductase subunit alpha
LISKIRDNRSDIIELYEDQVDDADVVVVAYGISARTSARPIRIAREEGLKVGLLKLVTVWPFAEDRIRELAERVRAFVVPEINMGQIVLEVERCAAGQAESILVPHAGGGLHDPEEVLSAIRRAAR